MKKINDFENVEASADGFDRPTAGGYCIEILSVEDVPIDEKTGKGDYLKIEYDICSGKHAGYYAKQNERFGGTWMASFIRSYKEAALGMFKHFTNCVESSNPGYKWAWDEKTLVHKCVGAVLGEEEYEKKDGSVGTRLVVKSIKTCEQIAAGDFQVPAIKKLAKQAAAPASSSFVPLEELGDLDGLPF